MSKLYPHLCFFSHKIVELSFEKNVRQDLEGRDGPDVGSLSELINLGVCFGANPEHLLDWLQGIVEALEHIHHTQGQNVPKFAVHLMKSINDFAGRTSPCLKVSARLMSAQIAIVTVSTLLSWKDPASKVERYLRCHRKVLSAQNLLGQTSLHLAADWACLGL